MTSVLIIATNVVVYGLAIKSVTIGSDFSFFDFAKHRGKYLKWYTNRETFSDHRKKQC